MKNTGFVEEVSRLIDGTTYTTKLGYDATTHQLNRVEYPASGNDQPFAVRYAYDAFGNLKSLTGTSPDRTTETTPLWQLDEAYQGSAIQKETFGNGVSSSYTYEQATGRLKTALTRGGPGNPVLQDLRYDSYDNNGNLKSRHSTFKRVGSSTTDTYADTFNCDQLDRLDDYAVNGVTADVNYDELGNITFRTGIGSYSYLDPAKTYRPHAVLGLTKNGTKVADFEYDDYGNIKRRSGEGVAGGTQQLTHTSFNLPSTISLGEGASASQIRYEYDAGQKRVLLAVGDCGSSNNPSCNKRIYVGGAYERQNATDAGGPVTRHAYKVFAGSRQVAQIEREQRSGATVETRRFLHDDHLGSSQLITNEVGELTHVQRLDPFGAPADTPGSAPDGSSARIRTGFTGHETDVETGLVNMQGRLYDARIGRFMQADPPFMESPGWSQGLNRYSYVFNNPLNLIDPSGFMEEHDHPDDEDASVSESADPETGMQVFEQSPITEEDGESFGVDEGSLNDNADEEAETSPGQGDPADESGVGRESEGLGQDRPAWHIPPVLDWMGGFGIGYMQGVVPGGTFLPIAPGSFGYQLSVALGQLAGGVSGVIGGGLAAAGGTAATATGVAAPVSVPVAVAGGAVAVADAANVANAIGNILKIGSGGTSDPPSASQGKAESAAQQRILSKGEIKKLKEAGIDVHELKGENASKFDLYKDSQGNIVVKLKGGIGEGDPTGLNINDF